MARSAGRPWRDFETWYQAGPGSLAEQLDLSTPVREALRRPEPEHLIVRRAHRGALRRAGPIGGRGAPSPVAVAEAVLALTDWVSVSVVAETGRSVAQTSMCHRGLFMTQKSSLRSVPCGVTIAEDPSCLFLAMN